LKPPHENFLRTPLERAARWSTQLRMVFSSNAEALAKYQLSAAWWNVNSALRGHYNFCSRLSICNPKFGVRLCLSSPRGYAPGNHWHTRQGGLVPPNTVHKFRPSATCSKILNDKKYFNTVKIFRAYSVFQGKRKVAQKSWMVNSIFNTVTNFWSNSVFQGKRKLLKNPKRWKTFQYSIFSVYSLGVIHVIWASVVCNLDKNRDWL